MQENATVGSDSGFPAAERLRDLGLPWIFHTGNADTGEMRRARPTSGVFMKPADPAAIVDALASLVR